MLVATKALCWEPLPKEEQGRKRGFKCVTQA